MKSRVSGYQLGIPSCHSRNPPLLKVNYWPCLAFALPWASVSRFEQHVAASMITGLPWGFQVLMETGSRTQCTFLAALRSRALSTLHPQLPTIPYLHVRCLFQRQAHWVSPVHTQHRAKRAHAAPTAATEELRRSVAVIRAAPTTCDL